MADRLTVHECKKCGKGIVASTLRFHKHQSYHRNCLPKEVKEIIEPKKEKA